MAERACEPTFANAKINPKILNQKSESALSEVRIGPAGAVQSLIGPPGGVKTLIGPPGRLSRAD